MGNIIKVTIKDIKKYEIIERLINKEIDGTQASILLNLSVRQTKRIKASVLKAKKEGKPGIMGVIHKNRGKESKKKIPESEKEKIAKLKREKYFDFTPVFFKEKLEELHNINYSYGSIRNILISKNLYKVKARKINKKHFSQRERKDSCGELVQYDGSYHDWFEGRCIDKGMEQEQCLLVSVDDASNDLCPRFAENEGIKETFTFWKNYILKKGKPIAIYIDKFSTYKVNHPNATDNKDFKTQFQRAMEELGIKVIFANSPQAKGRVERMNKTLQDRLIKELRLAQINNAKDANEFIIKKFTPEFVKKFGISPKKKENLHRKLSKEELKNINNIFSIKQERKVRNDFVVQYQNRYFQLEKTQPTTVYKKDAVIVEEHLDESIHICKASKQRKTYLSFVELNSKPTKEINIKLPAITKIKTSYIPPANHPWRNFVINKARQKFKEKR